MKIFQKHIKTIMENVHVIEAEYDEEGVYFYQAFNDDIADQALENQILGGPLYKPERMTWIKPSFAWMLYRSGYASKHNQNRILKIKSVAGKQSFLKLMMCKVVF